MPPCKYPGLAIVQFTYKYIGDIGGAGAVGDYVGYYGVTAYLPNM